jgi:5-methylcytosine-specific restriction endonuclease McrA
MSRPNPYRRALYQRNRKLVLEAAGWRCVRCGRAATTVDHLLPLRLGGSHDVTNLRAMCVRCNSQGGADLTNALKAQRRLGRQSRHW